MFLAVIDFIVLENVYRLFVLTMGAGNDIIIALLCYYYYYIICSCFFQVAHSNTYFLPRINAEKTFYLQFLFYLFVCVLNLTTHNLTSTLNWLQSKTHEKNLRHKKKLGDEKKRS